MRIQLLSFLLACSIISPAFAVNEDSSFTLYLIRHAEKLHDGSRDPELSAAGVERSEKLADWFSDKNIQDVWSSDYKRTRNTANPTDKKLNLDLTLYDPGDLATLTEKLLARQHPAVIVGHSNTTPNLAKLLCDCEIEDMGESEYDRLIVISVDADGTRVKIVKQR
jgi:phosphohistidine phosphatase SixA